MRVGMPPGSVCLWRSESERGICLGFGPFGPFGSFGSSGARQGEGEEGRRIGDIRGIRADVEHPFERYA